jgi:hypothetical protein
MDKMPLPNILVGPDCGYAIVPANATWARVDGRLVRTGDVAVVQIMPDNDLISYLDERAEQNKDIQTDDDVCALFVKLEEELDKLKTIRTN